MTNYFGKQSFQQLKGYISSEPQEKNGLLRAEFTLLTGYKNYIGKPTSGKTLILISLNRTSTFKLQYGDELLLPAKQAPVEVMANPGEFDFKAWLATKQIHHQLFLNQQEIIKLKTKNGNWITAFAINVRKTQVSIYRKFISNDEAFAVASTLILGYRTDLNKETIAAYSKTGTIHALSVSGMHVSIIYIFLNWALSALNRSRVLKIIKVLLICTLIWGYALLTGFSPSVLRSAVMLTIYIMAKAMNKKSNSYNILAFTAFVLLCYNPFLLYDVGFQLSFLAVFGLIYLHPKIYKLLYVKNYLLNKLWSTTALSLSAQIVTFPLSIYYFHQFPLYFLFSNLFILIPLTLMMYLGIGILLLRLYFLAPFFEWIIIFTNNGLKWISNLPFAGVNAIWINGTQFLLLSLSLALTVYALDKYHKKLIILAMSVLLILMTFTTWHRIALLHQKKILFFSLRKYYATAFISGSQAVLITDLELNNPIFEFTIKPALEKFKIDQTHFIDWKKDTLLGAFIKKNHQIYFYKYNILLVDKHLDNQYLVNAPKYGLIWLHENPNQSLTSLYKATSFNKLIIDASNHHYTIKKYLAEANKFGINSYNLKKNKAYLIDLNHNHGQ